MLHTNCCIMFNGHTCWRFKIEIQTGAAAANESAFPLTVHLKIKVHNIAKVNIYISKIHYQNICIWQWIYSSEVEGCTGLKLYIHLFVAFERTQWCNQPCNNTTFHSSYSFPLIATDRETDHRLLHTFLDTSKVLIFKEWKQLIA